MDFSKRSREAELMDDPKVSPQTLKEVLQDINRANRILGGNKGTIRAVAQLVSQNPKESYSVLDMGCGDGAMLREVVFFFRRIGKSVKCLGIDLNGNALQIARKASLDFPEITYLERDIMDSDTQGLACDILITTLTLHHFYDEQIPAILKRFSTLAHIGVVINDLQRSPLAYSLFKMFSLIFIHSAIAKNDGLVSIERGFTKAELMQFSKGISGVEHKIMGQWAFRYVWIIKMHRLTRTYE
ncbi:methyltransferase domain-containing protein [Ulvibacterium sp.]|uniref:methyltransferase domain-containing protein n=1 Tax=Ulvibacterium sp. TaxID=2665914 RepID=UPI00260ED55E|nr:methyltransferase domain-containing protein [Ulvibacterium sp.]